MRILQDFELEDTIERIDGEAGVLGAWLMDEDVPALVMELDAIGLDVLHGVGHPEALIVDAQHLLVADGHKDRLQKLLSARDVFEQDLVLEVATLGQKSAGREGIDEPMLDIGRLQVLGVADVVAVTIATVAFDVDAEHLLDGVAVMVEGGARHGEALAHLGGEPAAVDVVERDLACTIDGIEQPGVLTEQEVCLHIVLMVMFWSFSPSFRCKYTLFFPNRQIPDWKSSQSCCFSSILQSDAMKNYGKTLPQV